MLGWHDLNGDNYEVGYQLGHEWGRRLASNADYWRFWKRRIGRELSWNRRQMHLLLANVVRAFPAIAEEIDGMARGGCDAGLRTSFLDVFACALGEMTAAHCTSVVAATDGGILLGHNEEDGRHGWLCPLLFARVRLKIGNGAYVKFVSVSYPFQLLGSSAGTNGHIAFQGNSFG